MSRAVIPPKGSSTAQLASLLVRNCRLLDLDEAFDCPLLEESTFAAIDGVQNTTRRVFCALWLYYKLLQRAWPEDTASRFQGLFPPLEAAQISSLKAAIYIRLSELKRTGCFGKNVTIRKTSFDSCKGPEFIELLAVFSSAVLLQVLKQDRHDLSIVYRQLDKPVLSIDTVTLSLAYKSSLTTRLRTREALDRRWRKFGSMLDFESQTLDQRNHEHQSISRPQKRIPQRTLARLRIYLAENWAGDQDWIQILLEGDKRRPTGKLLERPFQEVWENACNDTLYTVRAQRNCSLLQALESRVQEQQQRLSRWKSAHSAIMAKREARVSSEYQRVHDEMTLNTRTTYVRPQSAVSKTYALRSKTAAGPVSIPSHTPATLKSETAKQLAIDRPSAGHVNHNKHRRSRSAIAQPAAVSSFSSSGAATRQMSSANAGATSMNVTHLRKQSLPAARSADVKPKYSPPDTRSRSPFTMNQDDDVLSSPADVSEDFSNENIQAAEIVNSTFNTDTTIHRAPMTLAERTQASMAVLRSRPDSTVIRRPEHRGEVSIDNVPFTSAVALSDLAERTRQSMALRSPDIQPTSRPQLRSRLSQAYPVNQFETLRKTAVVDESAFDETTINLDEADIFKSRPRIAVSPVLTPMAETGAMLHVEHSLDDSYEDDFS